MKQILKKGLILLAALSLLLMAGCSGQNPSSQRMEKNEIVISGGHYFISGNYDPTQGWGVWGPDPFHTGLMKLDENNDITEDLAESVEVDPSGLVYTVRLREGIKFSDGTLLTPSDVTFTYLTAKKAASAVDLHYLDKAEVKDNHTVVFTLSEPWSTFRYTMAMLGIVPEHAYGADYPTHPVGTGAWKLVDYQKEQQLIMEPNPYYYGEKPKLNKVTVVNIASDTALAAAKSGQVDVIFISPEFSQSSVEGMRLVLMDSIESFVMNLPVQEEHMEGDKKIGNNVTADKAIREALQIGISRKAIIQNALQGLGHPTYGFDKVLPWANQNLAVQDGDVEKAKDILEKAGWVDTDGDGIREKNGMRATFTISGRSNDPDRYHVAVAIAEEAKKLGIDARAESTPWNEAVAKALYTPTIWALGEFNPQVVYNYYDGSQIGVNKSNNTAGYNNQATNEAIKKAMQSTDVAAINANFQEAQWGQKIEIPYLWVATATVPYFVNNKLDVGKVRVSTRGQGMSIIANLSEWSWKK